MSYESPLRDLARRLRGVAREHRSYSQVTDLMNHIDDHLNALAFHEEECRDLAKVNLVLDRVLAGDI